MKSSNKRESFHQILAEPDGADINTVEELCKTYPYAASLWPVRARLSFLQNRPDAKELFQKAVLYSGDPATIRAFVFKTVANQETAPPDQPVIPVEGSVPRRRLLENSTTKRDEESVPSRYLDDWMPYSYVWWLQKTRLEYADTYQPYAQKDSAPGSGGSPNPLDQQIREHIFNLQDPEQKLSEQFDGKAKPFQVPRKEDPIIEKFIKEEPQIKPPTAEKIDLENKARRSAEDNSGFVSETLANIYSEQGLYHKAIETYKKLSLKYPEKSLYFAGLIEQLNQKLN